MFEAWSSQRGSLSIKQGGTLGMPPRFGDFSSGRNGKCCTSGEMSEVVRGSDEIIPIVPGPELTPEKADFPWDSPWHLGCVNAPVSGSQAGQCWDSSRENREKLQLNCSKRGNWEWDYSQGTPFPGFTSAPHQGGKGKCWLRDPLKYRFGIAGGAGAALGRAGGCSYKISGNVDFGGCAGAPGGWDRIAESAPAPAPSLWTLQLWN